MGGAVSSGRDNNELIDNLMGGNYIRTRDVERVFRALDRADYMTPEARDQAYKDLAWRNGPLHMSAPCIYSEVMEGLELKPGLSFLNVGSGTGYLSTLVGLIIGSGGISHGVEVHPKVVEYANKKLSQFMENSPTLDEFDFCEPKFYSGNGLCLAPLQTPYDRVYCGAGCPEEYQNYFQQLIKVGGVLVMPLNDNLLQVRRTGAAEWSSRSLLNVSFATLRVPASGEARDLVLEEQSPARLQALCRAAVRAAMRAALRRRHPQLREPPPRAPPAKKACPRRICIPIDDDSDNAESLNALHDLNRTNGASEMNALLSLVLSMGHNRVAGALRVDNLSSDSESYEPDEDDDDDDDDDDDEGGGDDGPDHGDVPVGARRDNGDHHSGSDGDKSDSDERTPVAQNIIMFGFRDLPSGDTSPEKLSTVTESQATPATPDKEAEAEGSTPKIPKKDREDSPQSDKKREDSPPSDKCEDSPPADKKDSDKPSRPKSRRRTSKGSRRNSKETKGVENPEVPAEVEIYLEKNREEPGTSTMEWESTEVKEKNSSEEETETSTSKTKEEKRQKLDSGVGEENTPSAGSSPHTSKSGATDGDSRSDTTTDEGCDDDVKGRRRRQKRGHLSTRSVSSTEEEEEEGAEPARDPALERHARRHKRRLRDSYDARRVDLSILMKRGVKELPLPYALKKYVNLGRCFEF